MNEKFIVALVSVIVVWSAIGIIDYSRVHSFEKEKSR